MPITSQSLKTPPHDLEAERSVLGGILIDSSAINLVIEFLKPEHFYTPEHRLIFQAMLSLFEKQQPIDVVTIQDELKKTDSLKKIGGKAYLGDLINTVPTSANVENYGLIVKNHFVRRRLIELSSRLVEKSFDDQQEIKKILDEAEKEVFFLSQEHLHRDFIELKDILAESFERLDEFIKKGTQIRGISTGFLDLDNRLAGMQDSNLLILAARPGIGKTTFALNIALNAALKEKVGVGFFSLEMSKEELVDRLLVGQADIDGWRLKTGKLSDDDYKKITEAMGELSEAPIFIDDTPGLSIIEMRTKARKLKVEKNIKLLIVDYLQLANAGRFYESRVNEVSAVSQGLKNLARELRVPVLAVSQLSRAVEQRSHKKPQLSDLRESGCLSYDSLIVRADNGEIMKIGDLAEAKLKKPIPVYSLDEDWQITIKNIIKVFSSGRKQLFELKTQSGRVIKATANHKFRTLTGWVRLDQLKLGQRIALPRFYQPLSKKSPLKDEELILLAHLLGDGCVLGNQPIHYTSGDLESIEIVRKTAEKLFGIKGKVIKQKNWFHIYLSSPYHLTHNKHHPIINWYKKLLINPVRSYEKEIPLLVFQSEREKISLFLKHLWSTDGNISWKRLKGRQPSAAIYYSSTSKKMIEQIQHLLLRLGIFSTIRSSVKKRYRTNWQLHIQGVESQLVFLTKVGCFGKKGRIVNQLINSLKMIKPNPNNDIIAKEVWQLVRKIKDQQGLSWRDLFQKMKLSYSGGFLKNGVSRRRLKKIAQVLQSKEVEDLANSDVYWDKIISFVPLGIEEVYDATIEETHNFIANDIIVHNSIEQDADVVMFLYQEEESEDLLDQSKRLVKLFIAKHRNGPTGEIDLMFRGDRVKFYGVEK